jgi:Ion channel
MRVLAMVFVEVYFYFLVTLSTALASCSYWVPMLVYVNSVVLLAMLYLQIVSIPLQLNWSRNMYGGLLRRQFFFVLYSAVVYGVHFHFAGIVASDKSPGSMLDAIYFSFTTWTTLGYGDFVVANPSFRLATSLEALTGVLTTAVLTATVWLYCQERLQPRSTGAEQNRGLEEDPAFGVWHELESESTRDASARRGKLAALQPCPRCGRSPRLDKFFDITGRLAPFAWFMAVCDCGAHSRPRRNAYLAEREWNRNGPVKPKAELPFLHAQLFRIILMPGRVVALARTGTARVVRWLRMGSRP